MENIFQFNNYKEYLRAVIHSPHSPRGLQTKLSRHLNCQSAYIYQVLKGKGDLTEDQAYKFTTYFEFSRAESSYFLLLVRLAKANSRELKEYLLKELKLQKEEQLNLKNKSDADPAYTNDRIWNYYFSSSIPSLIHILTSSQNYQTIEAIAKKLNLPNSMVNEHLLKLAQFNFVKFKNNKWIFSSSSIHFPKDSHHNMTLQLLRRSQVANSIVNSTSAQDVHFCSLFTLDKSTYENLQEQISKFVHKAQKSIHEGGTDEPYVMCIDLFSPTY